MDNKHADRVEENSAVFRYAVVCHTDIFCHIFIGNVDIFTANVNRLSADVVEYAALDRGALNRPAEEYRAGGNIPEFAIFDTEIAGVFIGYARRCVVGGLGEIALVRIREAVASEYDIFKRDTVCAVDRYHCFECRAVDRVFGGAVAVIRDYIEYTLCLVKIPLTGFAEHFKHVFEEEPVVLLDAHACIFAEFEVAAFAVK